MSTIFGVIRKDKEHLYNEVQGIDVITSQDIAIIATRGNIGVFTWSYVTDTQILISHLPDSTKVFPLDNTAQGITTIGDIRAEMAKQ